MPPHVLRLKVNQPVVVLRNLDLEEGLCNGTKLICRALHAHFIEAEIASGRCIGNRVYIPRIKLSSKDSGSPCELTRKQLPVKPAFCMTINKAQGQTLSHVGVYLPSPAFSHGQLYVAMSRVTDYRNLFLMTEWDAHGAPITKNIVYPEVFPLAQQ